MSTTKKPSRNKTLFLITALILVVLVMLVYFIVNKQMVKTASEQSTISEPTDKELDMSHEEYQEPSNP